MPQRYIHCITDLNTVQLLLDLLRLQLNRLPIHKYSLALVRFRSPPYPDLSGKLVHNLLVWSLQQDPRRLWCASCHSHGYSQLDRMRVAHFQRNEFLAWIFRLFGDSGRFDSGSEADSHEA